MKQSLVILTLFSVISICCGCASNNAKMRNGNLTTGNVEMHLKTGITTKSQVIDYFGAPNITTTDASGHDEWIYQRQATITQSSNSAGYWTILLAGSGNSTSGFQQSQKTMTLIIKFNKKDVVSDFRSRSSQF